MYVYAIMHALHFNKVSQLQKRFQHSPVGMNELKLNSNPVLQPPPPRRPQTPPLAHRPH